MTPPITLPLLLLVLPLAALLALETWLHHRQTKMWMRLFSERYLQTNPIIMEDKAALDEMLPKPPEPPRKRISVPIPGASLFKRPPSAH